MAPTLVEMMKNAREKLKANGANVDDALNALGVDLMSAFEEHDKKYKKAFDDLEHRVNQDINERIVAGQQALRGQAETRSGWGLQDPDSLKAMIDPAGLTMMQKLTLPDRELQRYLPKATYERVKIFQELNDDAMIMGWIMATKEQGRIMGNSSAVIEQKLKSTRTWKALQEVHKALTTTGTATGLEWMPTSFSSQLVDVITISLKIAANFSRINIPTNVFKVPIGTTDDIAFLVPETTSDNLLDDANSYPKFTPGTGNVTFQAKKAAAIVVFSEESEEDSIIPMLPFIKGKIAMAMANAQERATLDGDITVPHMDFDVTAPTDIRKAFYGMRYKALVPTACSVDLTTFDLINVRKLRATLSPQFAENPEQLFYACSVKVLLKLLNFPEFLTIDKYGPNATIVTGEVGRIDGSPVQTSKYSRDNVSATGVNTTGGPNDKGLLYLQNRLGFWYGDRREIRIEGAKMIMSGQGFMVISQRYDFKDIYPVANGINRHGALGFNIT